MGIFSDDDDLMTGKEKLIRHNKQNLPEIRNIDDLQNYLKKQNLNENDGLNVVSRFLISDDYYSKQHGVIFDVTGFDGLMVDEKIQPENTIEREAQRARSAARIHFQKIYNDESYEPIGAQQLEVYNEDWKVFKVMMASKATLSQQSILKVCLPKNEGVSAIVSDINANCTTKINFIDDIKNKGKPYLNKIKSSHIFRPVDSNKQNNNNNNNNNNQQQQQFNNNQVNNQQQQLNNNQFNNQQNQQFNNNQQQQFNNNQQQQFNNNPQQQFNNNQINNQQKNQNQNQSEIKKLNNNINQNIIQNNQNLMQNNNMKNNNMKNNMSQQNNFNNASFMQKNENRKKQDENIEKDKSNTPNSIKKINEVNKTPTKFDQK